MIDYDLSKDPYVKITVQTTGLILLGTAVSVYNSERANREDPVMDLRLEDGSVYPIRMLSPYIAIQRLSENEYFLELLRYGACVIESNQ